ncbi:MAG TPA: imidazole glycerol phosphate synthase subunit HisH, partial [Microlunatus sp.]|nr:imidazole glycerol phosphate synthase subunit HisH [Microlunatus sp.]
YFVHSYAVRAETLTVGADWQPKLTWADHQGDRFVAGIEDGPVWATQFHPEKSGEAGRRLITNWLARL